MNITQWFLVGIGVILLVYDAINTKIGQPSESTAIRDWAWTINTIPLTFGILCGHWFLPRHTPLVHSIVGNVLPFILACGVYDALWYWLGHGDRVWWRYPGFLLLVGIPIGSWLWAAASPFSPF